MSGPTTKPLVAVLSLMQAKASDIQANGSMMLNMESVRRLGTTVVALGMSVNSIRARNKDKAASNGLMAAITRENLWMVSSKAMASTILQM